MASPSWRHVAPFVYGIGSGTLYGVGARLATREHAGSLLGVMTLGFLFAVPAVIGFLSVRPHPKPTVLFTIFAPIVACVLSLAFMLLAGWEGAICVAMAAPIMFFLAVAGGFVAYQLRARETSTKAATVAALVLPFALAPLEKLRGVPTEMRTVESEIAIAASPEAVWSEIVQVPAIAKAELQPSLATRLGFPRPIAATLDHAGVGGVRRATFEGGVLFVETITEWRTNERLRFTIAADTHSIPPTTLDEHVTIGGPYFDVLTGTYSIEPRGGGVVLHLTSELRVSTPFNFYAGPWVDAIMQSIQTQILAVLRARSERRR